MSWRGSFCTEFIYCKECFSVIETVLKNDGYEYVTCHTDGGSSAGILSGFISSLAENEEVDMFKHAVLSSQKNLCHSIVVAVIGETGNEIFILNEKIEEIANAR